MTGETGLVSRDLESLTYADIARLIDHALLHPALTDAELRVGCRLAAEYGVASVCIKPYAVPMAVELLKGTEVAVGTVIAFPHGSATIEVKRFETRVACREGATEIDMVINIGKAMSADWEFVERDIFEVAEETHAAGALLKVIFENGFLIMDEAKVKLCQICERVGADFMKTATGFGFVRQADGSMLAGGATERDLVLMRRSCLPNVQLKAAGGIRDLSGLLRAVELGATRIGTSSTKAILEELRRRVTEGSLPAPGSLTSAGY